MGHEIIKSVGSSIQPWQQLASNVKSVLNDTEQEIMRASLSAKIKDIPNDKYILDFGR